MLQRGDAIGVFQFESSGMREALRSVKPTEFEDLIALVALYRPGPMGYIPGYAQRKKSQEGGGGNRPPPRPLPRLPPPPSPAPARWPTPRATPSARTARRR